MVLSKFEISRSGQFTCPVGCGALFVSRGPPDVDQATREKYANHIFYESEGARRWRRYLESQPEGYLLDRTGPGGLQVRDEGWPEDDDGPLKPFLGTDMSLFPDAAAVGDWIRRGCERERASTVFDGVDSLQKVHDLIREGVLPPIAAIHTSAAGVVVEFETSRSNHRAGASRSRGSSPWRGSGSSPGRRRSSRSATTQTPTSSALSWFASGAPGWST